MAIDNGEGYGAQGGANSGDHFTPVNSQRKSPRILIEIPHPIDAG